VGGYPALRGVRVELRGRRGVHPARAGREGERVRRGVRVGARPEHVVEQAEREVRVEPHARRVRRRREGGGGGLGLRVAWRRRLVRGGERSGGEEEGNSGGRHSAGRGVECVGWTSARPRPGGNGKGEGPVRRMRAPCVELLVQWMRWNLQVASRRFGPCQLV
jgi:hypothetical protein